MRIAAISLPELRIEVVRAQARANAINAINAANARCARAEPGAETSTGTGTGTDFDDDVEMLSTRAGMPLAIVVAPAPLTEAKLLGNTRLDVVSREARVLGIHPGQTIAQARARASNLAVRVVRPEAVHGVLARLAEVALAFGATVSFSSAGSSGGPTHTLRPGTNDAATSVSYGDVVWVDVTGCAHLHAPRRESRESGAHEPRSNESSASEGEAVLASRLARVFGGLGHVCTVAIADGPRVAAILARAAASSRAATYLRTRERQGDGPRARHRREEEDDDEPHLVIVPPGKNGLALAPLPVAALPIADEDARWLSKIGVHTIAELRSLPRSALSARLGVRAPVVIGLAEGDDRAPLTSYVPPEVPEEEATLDYGIEGSEALTFVAKTLADRLAARLAGRAVAASRIELDLLLDSALLRENETASAATRTERVQRIAVELPVPLSSASDLLAALRPKIERAVLRAPVLGAKLRAASLVHKPQAALSLFEAQPKAERALPRLVAELAADLGEEAVGKLALGDAWLPEERSRFVRLEVKATTKPSVAAKAQGNGNANANGKPSDEVNGRKRRHMLSSVPEPTRILSQPVPVPRDAVKVVRHLSRVESVDWWRRLPGEGPKKGVDYVHAWVDDGAAWVEIDRATGAARVCGWFD